MEELIQTYLKTHLSDKPDWVIKLEQTANEENVPIMESISIDYMLNLIKIHQPKRILEVGTAIGYSALRMLEACPTAEIITIEKDEERFKQAQENIENQNKTNHIKVFLGDAIEVIQKKANEATAFDFIFIDAAKGKYEAFFDLVHPLLREGGILVIDNVLFRGYVANPELAPKRFKNMVKKIAAFNDLLTSHPAYITSILPIGDGVMVCYKNVGKESQANEK